MPIYEYLCRDCNTVYQFYSRTSSLKADPCCPKFADHSVLERQMSGFAIGGPRSPSEAGLGPADDPAIATRMEGLLSKMETLDENDPRAMGRLMREMSDLTGERDPAMEEAIRRLEGGEDPERIEEILGTQHEAASDGMGGIGTGAPSLDGNLYEM